VQYIDTYSKLNQLQLSNEAEAIINACINNRRIYSETDAIENCELLTQGIKYATRNKPRARYRPISEIDSNYNPDSARRTLKLLGHIDNENDQARSLKFQLDSWQQILNQNGLRKARGDHKGLMITAPTGFGKTACFMGGTIDKVVNGNFERVIFVYPSRALLQDQLSRVLSIVHRVNKNPDTDSLSAGLWYGNQPYYVSQIFNDDKYDFVEQATGKDDILKVTNHWNEDLSDRHFTIKRTGKNRYRVKNEESNVSFTQDEFILNRDNIREKGGVGPDILLTTLESLELFGMKPHYNLVTNTDAFVFDEIHQYTGLRGAHATQIISNIKSILSEEDRASLFIGSSATLEAPESFGKKIFGFDKEEDLSTIQPSDTDCIESQEDIDQDYVPDVMVNKGRPDKQHFHFMLTPDGGPGVASQYIQHAMMVGHSLSRPVGSDSTQKQMLSFIQSKSQIQSLTNQLHNADHERQLWQHHRNIDDDGDWQDLSDATDHTFFDKPLDIKGIHANSDTKLSDLADADIIQSTSFLELGIDIGNLKYISQYRPPGSLSSFKQRAGRAGRTHGADAHTFTLLSKYGGDANFYYRADRFLDRDITTPLKADNPVAEWIHDVLVTHYRALDEFKTYHGNWFEKEEKFLYSYFSETLEWNRFAEFLLETKSEFEALFDTSTAADSGLLVDTDGSSSPVRELQDILQSIKQDQNDELRNIRLFAHVDTEQALLGDDEATHVVDAIRDELDTVYESMKQLDHKAGDESTPGIDTNELITLAEENIRGSDNLPVDERIRKLGEGQGNLEALRPALDIKLPSELQEELPERHKIHDIKDALDDLQELRSTGKINKYGVERKRAYYLEQCLDQIKEYRKGEFAPHGSLYYIKYLLRAAYYYYRCVNVDSENRFGTELPESEGRDEDTNIWYVPPNYFNDSGRYFWLKSDHHSQNDREVSIDAVLSQYAPFNEEYVDTDGNIQIFQPRVVREDGVSKIDFSETFGNTHKGVKTPEQIRLDVVKDLSGSEGRDILAYSDFRFQILEDENVKCPGGSHHRKYGKIYSKPTVKTEVDELSLKSVGEFHALEVGGVDAKAWIDSVDVEIQPREKGRNGFYKPDDAETVTKHLETTDTKFGYVLETQGIKWDLSEYIEDILPGGKYDCHEAVSRHKGDITEEELAEIALNTAAHYLTLLVSDISGVNARMLLHSIDWDNRVIYVFEQTEGGQGIVDHFERAVQKNPGAVLKSSYDQIHNPQIVAEYLFSDEEFITQILDVLPENTFEESGDLDPLRDTIADYTVSTRQISFNPSVRRIQDEVVSYLRDIENLSQMTDGVNREEAYNLKQALAAKRTAGVERDTAFEELSGTDEFHHIFDECPEETIESLLWSPDIDDCEMNLQLPNYISNTTGTDKKSHICLRYLLEYITAPATTGELQEMMSRNSLWARETEDGPIFLDL